MTSSLPTSILSRSSRLLSAAARVGASELNRRIAPWAEGRERLRQAQVVAETMSELKGAVMKVGQLLSLDAESILPPEVADVLSRLQDDAEPVDFETVRLVLDAELGPRFHAFERFDEQPHAAASIGQVHRARLSGEEVAVKVQYPRIAESIDSDLKALRRLVGALLSLSGRSIDTEEVFEELRIILHREANYEEELRSLTDYRAMLMADDRFVVPRAFPELSTRRVLTMSFEAGTPLYAFLRRNPPMEQRYQIARSILDLYCVEFFEEGLVQTDPNPGNFLIRGDGRIVLLDLGAAVRYPADFRRNYVELLKTLGSGEQAQIIDAGLQMGFIDPRESDEVKALFADFLGLAVEPFHSGVQPFEFANSDYARRSRDVGVAFTRSLKYSPPPRQLIFLHRKLGGIFNIIKRMGVTLDLSPYWERFVGTEAPERAA